MLKEELKEQYNESQQAAIASVVSPGQALFSLLQVRHALLRIFPSLHLIRRCSEVSLL